MSSTLQQYFGDKPTTTCTAWAYRFTPYRLFWCHPISVGRLWDISLVLQCVVLI